MPLPPLLRVIAELGADAASPIPLPPQGEVDVLHPKGLAYLLETGTLGDSPALVAGATVLQWVALARGLCTIVLLVVRRWRCGAVWSAVTPVAALPTVLRAGRPRRGGGPAVVRREGSCEQDSEAGVWCPLPRVAVGGCRMDVERA